MTGVTEAAKGRPTTGAVASDVDPDPTDAGAPASVAPLTQKELRGALEGHDRSARNKLIARFGPLLVAFAEGRRAPAADEAASGVLLSMFREPAGWPTTEAALRTALLRSLRLRLIAEDVETEDDVADADASDAVLAALDPDQRDLVLLRTLCGLDQAQVGVVLDRPIHSVKSLQRHTVSALGHALQEVSPAP